MTCASDAAFIILMQILIKFSSILHASEMQIFNARKGQGFVQLGTTEQQKEEIFLH